MVRPAVAADAPFLAEMLAVAVQWRPDSPPRPLDEVLADPAIGNYLSGWPRPGDVGLVAEVDGTPLGAVWCRHFSADDPGYGFVAADVPELSIGVVAGARGRGIGRRLLLDLVSELGRLEIARVSLSVETDNPAMGLYADVGFVELARRAGAATMVLDTTAHAPGAGPTTPGS